MFKQIRTSKRKSEFWAEKAPIGYCDNVQRDKPTIVVDSSSPLQTHLGFGGGFTESAAHVANLAGKEARAEILKAYFSKEGLDYNLGRTVVHSCDFSLNNYAYIDEGDTALNSFDMSHDDKLIVPFIQDAIKVKGEPLKLFASSWTPPAFMKTNNDMNYGGRLKKEYYELYANYLVKYFLGMKKRGINIFATSIQNEPEAVQVWESNYFSAQDEGEFIADFLQPALQKNGLDDINIIIWDHNRDRVVRRASETLANDKAKKAVWGVGYHWYVGSEHKNLTTLKALFPDKHILLTECCVELTNTAFNSSDGNIYSGSWAHGEHYGKNIINDFNNFSEGWIDWNLVLDEKGGPNHVSNFCEAPVMFDTVNKKIIYNPSYYYIGHFSKYIQPGAKRITCCNDIEKDVYATAFKNPDGKIVIVVQNEGWVQEFAIFVNGKAFNMTMPDHSIVTLIEQ